MFEKGDMLLIGSEASITKPPCRGTGKYVTDGELDLVGTAPTHHSHFAAVIAPIRILNPVQHLFWATPAERHACQHPTPLPTPVAPPVLQQRHFAPRRKIGRASCRERV